jgi:hypothetical protein
MGLSIIAIGFIVAGALVPRLRRSEHPWARVLLHSYGVRPSGPDGVWTRHDRLRSARGHGLLFVALVGSALTVMGLADRWQNGSRMNAALTFPGLVLFFAALVALWLTARDLLRAVLARPAVHVRDHST